MASSAVEQVVKAELKHYPGVELELKDGGKHDRAVFHFGGGSRFLVLPKTPSDWRTTQNIRRDLKKTLVELGVERLRYKPGTRVGAGPRGRGGTGKGRTRNADAAFAVNHQAVVIMVPNKSKLLSRFMTPDGKPTGHWTMELRASVNLRAPPMLALKKVALPPGHMRAPGITAGFRHKSGGWQIKLAHSALPALTNKVDTISSVNVKLYADEGDTLVFELPEGVIPTSFQPRTHEAEAPLPSQAWKGPVEAPQEREEPAPATEVARAPSDPQAGLQDRPIILQFPKQSISVEQAVAVLRRAKDRLGNNLRFTIEEGGNISAVYRIGK